MTHLEHRNRELEELLEQEVSSIDRHMDRMQVYLLGRLEDSDRNTRALMRSVEARVAHRFHPYVCWTVPLEDSWEVSL